MSWRGLDFAQRFIVLVSIMANNGREAIGVNRVMRTPLAYVSRMNSFLELGALYGLRTNKLFVQGWPTRSVEEAGRNGSVAFWNGEPHLE